MFPISPDPRQVFILGRNLWTEPEGQWFIGGEQRLISELSNIIISRGLKPVVVQPHTRDIALKVGAVQLLGIRCRRPHGFGLALWNRKVHRSLPSEAKVIYSYADLAYPLTLPNSLLLQHGVYWDGRSHKTRRRGFKVHLAALQKVRACMAVDTNFANVMMAGLSDPTSVHEKVRYIPNFAVASEGPPSPRDPGEVPIIVSVRRYSRSRGTDLLARAALKLWASGHNFKLWLVGHTDDKTYESEVRHLLGSALLDGRAAMFKAQFEDVVGLYEQAHVAVIPTLNGEGTSLSFLEAALHPVHLVSTRVGGLADLTASIPEVIACDANEASLANALERALASHLDPRGLAQRRSRIQTGFSRECWTEQVQSLLHALGWGQEPQ